MAYNRPADDELVEYREFAVRYFNLLTRAFPELKQLFASKKPAEVVKKYRHAKGGSVLFRPIGLTIFALLVEPAAKHGTLEDAVRLVGKLPTDLSAQPYVHLLWNPSTRTVELRRQALVRRLLLYMLGLMKGPKKVAKLKTDIAKARGIELKDVKLPPTV